MAGPQSDNQHRFDKQQQSTGQHGAANQRQPNDQQNSSSRDNRGSSTSSFDQAKDSLGSVTFAVSATGQDAVAGVQEVGDNIVRAIDDSLKNRPYTTLAIAFAMGMLFAKLS